MGEVVIRLGKETQLELHEIDVGVADGVISFDVSGVIKGLSEETLSELTGGTLIPTEIRFDIEEEPDSDV